MFSGLKFIVLSFRLGASSLHQKMNVLNLRAVSDGVEVYMNVWLVYGFLLDDHWLLWNAHYCRHSQWLLVR